MMRKRDVDIEQNRVSPATKVGASATTKLEEDKKSKRTDVLTFTKFIALVVLAVAVGAASVLFKTLLRSSIAGNEQQEKELPPETEKNAVRNVPAVRYKADATTTNADGGDNSEQQPFQFSSGSAEYDKAYNLAMTEIDANTNKAGRFIAGAGWTQLWTRDTSYAVELAAGLVRPEASRASLEACTEIDGRTQKKVWLQDTCGHFNGWPNLSDAIVGAEGAWSLFLVSGDLDFLKWSYDITKNSLARAERDVYDSKSGLFLGCSSFMESNSGYPSKYRQNGKLVGKTKALSTNMLHYMGYKLGAMMAEELGASSTEIEELQGKASKLRDAIRSRLWLSEKGYYSYVEDEHDKLFPQNEGLGTSLVLLAPEFETDADRIDSIFEKTTRVEYGLPCLWPQFDLPKSGISFEYYHNGRLWPFVQGYWAVAAARHDKVSIFADELSHLVALSQKHNTYAEFYELDGTILPERSRQLWSDTGFLSMIFYGLFGMNCVPTGIKFDPVKPSSSPMAETISLKRVKYRKMVLDIFLSGSGSVLDSFKLDGESADPFVPSNLAGPHKVEMVLKEAK